MRLQTNVILVWSYCQWILSNENNERRLAIWITCTVALMLKTWVLNTIIHIIFIYFTCKSYLMNLANWFEATIDSGKHIITCNKMLFGTFNHKNRRCAQNHSHHIDTYGLNHLLEICNVSWWSSIKAIL